jgi:hemoglobin
VIKKDIASREDVQLLVDRFYEKVKSDALLAPIFAHVDWPEHLPVLYNFWTSMLLGGSSYQGNPFQKHLALPIRAEHFTQWLALFGQTIAENFSGEKADEAKSRATNIAGVFQFKLGLT